MRTSLRPARRGCGPLLDLDEVGRRLPLGNPIDEGLHEIAVANIVGTAGRSGDFDGCWRPRNRRLRKMISDIHAADAPTMLHPIDVFRVDEAYFVTDGHKRVAIARQTGMEFIDARVTALRTQYHVEPGIERESVELTAAEHRFRRSTGLAESVPGVRFHLWDPRDYAELTETVMAYGYEMSEHLRRLLPRAEAAAMWYENVHLPTVHAAREHRLRELIPACTDAYTFLWLHRQSRALLGTESTAVESAAESIVERAVDEERRQRAGTGGTLDRIVRRSRGRRSGPELLPEETERHPSGSQPS